MLLQRRDGEERSRPPDKTHAPAAQQKRRNKATHAQDFLLIQYLSEKIPGIVFYPTTMGSTYRDKPLQ